MEEAEQKGMFGPLLVYRLAVDLALERLVVVFLAAVERLVVAFLAAVLGAPRMPSLKALDGVKATFFRALMRMGSPVCGLRPVRALSCLSRKVPRFGTFSTLSFLTVLVIKEIKAVRVSSAWRLGIPPQSSANFFTISVFVIDFGVDCVVDLGITPLSLLLQLTSLWTSRDCERARAIEPRTSRSGVQPP